MKKNTRNNKENKENIKENNINNSFSYGKYLINNPKSTKEERIEAIKKFYQGKK